jgi:hypothetical protein
MSIYYPKSHETRGQAERARYFAETLYLTSSYFGSGSYISSSNKKGHVRIRLFGRVSSYCSIEAPRDTAFITFLN